MSKKYYDRDDIEIRQGMKIRHVKTSEVEEVFACGDGDLGINAQNMGCKFSEPAYYPLSEFDLMEWDIVGFRPYI